MDWIHFTVKDFVDVLLVATFLYYTYKALKTSGSRTLFTGIIAFIILWIIIYRVLEMRLMGAIMNQFMSVGFILLVILFQNDLRRFLNALGSKKRWSFLGKIFTREDEHIRTESNAAASLTIACINMARKKTGALIVIEGAIDLEPYEHTGERINADVNPRLIENIFFKNSPLHDGALIISNNKLAAAGCILPVAQSTELPKEMGLRHRSGLGITQVTDAKVVIISEERGKISVAHQGELLADVSSDQLRKFVSTRLTDLSVLKEVDTINPKVG